MWVWKSIGNKTTVLFIYSRGFKKSSHRIVLQSRFRVGKKMLNNYFKLGDFVLHTGVFAIPFLPHRFYHNVL